jgi:hypothetical protein
MRIVAVGAPHVVGVHLALQERAVLVHLVEDLAVAVIDGVGEQEWLVKVEQRPPGPKVLVDLVAPCVTLRTHF